MTATTVKLINVSPPHTVTSWYLSVRAPEIYSLSPFPVFNTVFCFGGFFWLHSTACGILVPPPGVKPVPPSVRAWNLNNWTTREVPIQHHQL